MASPAGPAPADPARRSALLATKLAALVRSHRGGEPRLEPGTFPGGAALLERTPGGGAVAWVLGDEQPSRVLGQGLAWARQAGAEALVVVVDAADHAGVLARRATAFSVPVEVFVAVGRELVAASPSSPMTVPPVPGGLLRFTELIEAAGATPLVEHGVLTGEVRGLEVCRAVVDASTGAERLEVGVGAHDREAFALMHGDVPTLDALAGVVRAVRDHRRAGAAPHPLQTLAASRWIRAEVLDRPAAVGAATLGPVDPPVVRVNVKDAVPCVAVGEDERGAPLVVVCSHGIDLDLVPFAADARLQHAAPATRLVLAVPHRDDHPVTRALAAMLRHPAEVLGLAWPPTEPGWVTASA